MYNVPNGTAALEIAIKALDIGEGDEVIILLLQLSQVQELL